MKRNEGTSVYYDDFQGSPMPRGSLASRPGAKLCHSQHQGVAVCVWNMARREAGPGPSVQKCSWAPMT